MKSNLNVTTMIEESTQRIPISDEISNDIVYIEVDFDDKETSYKNKKDEYITSLFFEKIRNRIDVCFDGMYYQISYSFINENICVLEVNTVDVDEYEIAIIQKEKDKLIIEQLTNRLNTNLYFNCFENFVDVNFEYGPVDKISFTITF